MSLTVQINTLLFSLIFGVFFSFLLFFLYKIINKLKGVYKTILTFIFVITSSLLYFMILRKINYGIMHLYNILAIVVGYIIGNYLINKLDIIKKNH